MDIVIATVILLGTVLVTVATQILVQLRDTVIAIVIPIAQGMEAVTATVTQIPVQLKDIVPVMMILIVL